MSVLLKATAVVVQGNVKGLFVFAEAFKNITTRPKITHGGGDLPCGICMCILQIQIFPFLPTVFVLRRTEWNSPPGFV